MISPSGWTRTDPAPGTEASVVRQTRGNQIIIQYTFLDWLIQVDQHIIYLVNYESKLDRIARKMLIFLLKLSMLVHFEKLQITNELVFNINDIFLSYLFAKWSF